MWHRSQWRETTITRLSTSSHQLQVALSHLTLSNLRVQLFVHMGRRVARIKCKVMSTIRTAKDSSQQNHYLMEITIWRSRNKASRHHHLRHSWPLSAWKRAKMFNKGQQIIRMTWRLHLWWSCHHRIQGLMPMANRRAKRSNTCATHLWLSKQQALMVRKLKWIIMVRHQQQDLSLHVLIQASICKWLVFSVETRHRVRSLTLSMDSFLGRSFHHRVRVWIQQLGKVISNNNNKRALL